MPNRRYRLALLHLYTESYSSDTFGLLESTVEKLIKDLICNGKSFFKQAPFAQHVCK